MQATMEGKQLTIEGRNEKNVRTLFNKGSVDLDNANFTVATGENDDANIVFSVHAGSDHGDNSLSSKDFFTNAAGQQSGIVEPYSIAMHGNVLIADSKTGKTENLNFQKGQYYVSVGTHNVRAAVNIVPKVENNENSDENTNILYIDQGGTYGYTKDKDGKNVSNNNHNNTYAGTVYIRKGYVEVRGNNYSDKRDFNADQGYGVISASRFVANNPAGGDTITNDKKNYSVHGATIPDLLTGTERSDYETGANRYDTYMVNPAYTSVMNDIKLTTRGGARLSDILPDFINKGIYVVNNTVKESVASKWDTVTDYDTAKGYDTESGDVGDDSVDMSVSSNWASPFMGVVPAPQCPPGYMRVITLTPASFEVGQAGLLRKSGSRYFITPDTPSDTQADEATKNPPRFENVSVYGNVDVNNGKETVHISPGSGSKGSLTTTSYVLNYTSPSTSTDKNSATKPNAPLMFQQSTRLKSMVIPLTKPLTKGGSYTQGWSAVTGFLYPYSMYSAFLEKESEKEADSSKSKKNALYWNVFPVIRGTMRSYATVYCYFNRTNMEIDKKKPFIDGYEKFIDNYSYMKDMTGVPSDYKKSPSNHNRVNDPALKYDEVW